MYYLAYGSNLHPLRLTLRVPNARLVGTARLDGYWLTFRKRSKDGSSKCNLEFTDDPTHVAYGAVYDVSAEEAILLDEVEGLGNGYYKAHVEVRVSDEPCAAFVYLASQSHISGENRPYHWYKGFVLAGVRKHDFPANYARQISREPSKPDSNESRRVQMENLLAQLEA